MARLSRYDRRGRRGSILVLSAIFVVVILGMVAFALDVGYISLAKTELQAAADSAAIAAAATMATDESTSITTAKKFAGYHKVGGKSIQLATSDIVYGTWNANTAQFAPLSSGLSNAVKVTARADSTTSGAVPLFFAKIFKQASVNSQASAVAIANARDICFVVDLSGSMNNDTDPANTASLDAAYPGVGTQMMRDFFSDFGFGTYPGTSQAIGAPLGVSSLTALTSTTTSPLLNTKQPRSITVNGKTYSYTVPAAYQTKSSDSSTVRTQKAYSWVIDEQLGGKSGSLAVPGIMKAAKPALNSTLTDNYNYWQAYISANSSSLGYLSYIAAIEPWGRTVKPFSASTLYSPLSVLSPDCPYHSEGTDGGTFNFPPREMPTHCARRSIISAIKVIKDRNIAISQSNQTDWVSIVSFDTASNVTTVRNLDNQYDAAMQACCKMQACQDNVSCTATESGLIAAMNLLNTQGRATATKVVILMTDGKPNLYSSTTSTISAYRSAHPNSNYYGGGSSYPQDAAMMQVAAMQANKWLFFPIEIGLQGDADFMDRIYSIGKGKTSSTDTSPYLATDSPANYESELKTIFDQIISTTKSRLVQ